MTLPLDSDATRPRALEVLRHDRRRGYTLFETLLAMALVGLVFAAVAAHLRESARLSVHITRTLEHSRSARELVDLLATDLRAAQIVVLHPGYADRATVLRDGQAGNYLVLQSIDPRGVIHRTVGYYVVSLPGAGGWAIFRHDSAAGDSAAGLLPAEASSGRHRLVKRVVRLGAGDTLFTSAGDRAVSLEGEFGPGSMTGTGRAELIRCTLSTRS